MDAPTKATPELTNAFASDKLIGPLMLKPINLTRSSNKIFKSLDSIPAALTVRLLISRLGILLNSTASAIDEV